MVAISTIILAISGIRQVEPLVLKQLTDTLVNAPTQEVGVLPNSIVVLLVFYLGVKLLGVILNRLSWYLSTIFTYKLRFSLRERGFAHLMRLPMSYFNKKQSGQLMSQLDRGTQQITSIINNSGVHFLPNLISALIGLVVVLQFNVWIGLAMVAAFIPVGIINYWKFTKNQKFEKKEHKLYDRQYGHFWEVVSGIKLIKSFVAERFEYKRLKQFHQNILSVRLKTERNHNIFTISDALLEAWVWFIYAWVVYLTYQSQFSLGTMVLMLSYVGIIREPLWTLNWVFWEAKRAQIGALEYFKILDEKATITSPEKPHIFIKLNGSIAFEHVSFGYKKDKDIFTNVSFSVPAGTACAFVGKSGAGKTTIVDLISRYYDVDCGSITIDGVAIKDFAVSDLRKSIGVVSQEPFLFADTIEENLRYGNPRATLQEMKVACQIAHADEFIEALPKGYQTKIGERGVRLSGGQKQRLSMARGFLKNPPILILDEATSQLDSHSEMLIQDALEKLMRGRTTVIIAHRLSTIQKADQIIVLEKGQIVEKGTHQALLDTHGLYASLFSIQSGNREALKEWGLVRS